MTDVTDMREDWNSYPPGTSWVCQLLPVPGKHPGGIGIVTLVSVRRYQRHVRAVWSWSYQPDELLDDSADEFSISLLRPRSGKTGSRNQAVNHCRQCFFNYKAQFFPRLRFTRKTAEDVIDPELQHGE